MAEQVEHVISSQDADEIFHDGKVKEWNQKTFEWINNMFFGYDKKWRWIYEWLGITYLTADGSTQEGDWENEPLRHRDMRAYETSRNTILNNVEVKLQDQMNQMKERITFLERTIAAHVTNNSMHNRLEDKKDIKF